MEDPQVCDAAYRFSTSDLKQKDTLFISGLRSNEKGL